MNMMNRDILEHGLEYCQVVKTLLERVNLTEAKKEAAQKTVSFIPALKMRIKENILTEDKLLQSCRNIHAMVRWVDKLAERIDIYMKIFGVEIQNPYQILYDTKTESDYKQATAVFVDYDTDMARYETVAFPIQDDFHTMVKKLKTQLKGMYYVPDGIGLEDIKKYHLTQYEYCGKIYTIREEIK